MHPDVYVGREPVRPRFATESNVGLEVDELAPLYPKDARLVIRCTDLESLQQHTRNRLPRLAALLPDWGIPELPPGTLVRVNCAIPDGVVIDHRHPVAFVETAAGWVALLPIEDAFENSHFLRRVEGRYCVSGSADAVSAYSHGGRPGHYLPGDISVMARGEAVADLGRRLTAAAAQLKVALPGIANWPGDSFAGIGRVDLALHCVEFGVRADLRIVPDPERAEALATLIAALDAHGGRALGRLPANGAFTLAASCDVASLLTMATQFDAPLLDPTAPARAATLQYLLAMLGDDTAVSLQLGRDAQPTLLMAAELSAADRRTVAAFLGSEKLESLLGELGGKGHTFSFKASDFEHTGTSVGTVHGFPSNEVMAALKADRVLRATFAPMLEVEGRIHIALAGNRLCVTMGSDARQAIVAILDRIRGKSDDGAAKTNGLHKGPLLEGSLDAATVLSLARPKAVAGVGGRLPVDFAVATEGDALRLTLSMPLERILAHWTERDASPAAPAESAPPTRD